MTAREKWIGVAAIVLLLAAAFVGYQWLQEHDARLKAESVQAAQGQIVSQAQKTIEAARADEQKAMADLAGRLEMIEKQKQQPVTPQQFVVDLNKLFPNLPQQANVIQPPPTEQTVNGKVEILPSAPMVQIPAADLQSLRDYKLGCDETGARLDACNLSMSAEKTQVDGLKVQLKATETERDEWKRAAKGGSVWHRTLTAAKWLGIGAAAGYAIAHR
jgi:hypothetical protein